MSTKRTVSFRLDEEIYRQAQEGAHWERTSVTQVVERALEEFVKKTQRKHNEGEPFTLPKERK